MATAEFQHGTIHRHHAAYNYGPAIRESSAYRPHLPDHLLTYGRYWFAGTRTPSRLWAIGNPYLTRRTVSLPAPSHTGGIRRVLVVSDASERCG